MTRHNGKSNFSTRQYIGALVLDVPRLLWAIRPDWLSGRGAWTLYRNRHEQLLTDSRGRGACLDEPWSYDLYLPKVYPRCGRQLMRRSLIQWPIQMEEALTESQSDVDVSFLIGHRGEQRLPHLLDTLRSIAGQQDVNVEAIVVEQSNESQIGSTLPDWVKHLHTPPPVDDMPYCRSWAFNIAARHARGRVLVLHDNDMLVPAAYARQATELHDQGYEVINLKRFIYYLDQPSSNRFGSNETLSDNRMSFDNVVQNLMAGGSIIVSREVFFQIGGFDEAFVGWGGEDNEFWDRAQTRRVWPYGFLPIIHLWHPSQAEKDDAQRQTANLLSKRQSIASTTRCRELAARQFGNADQLDPRYHASHPDRV